MGVWVPGAHWGTEMYSVQPFVVRPVSVEALDDDVLSGLYGYWRERAGSRAYPLRSDILPEHMAQVLDRLALLEVLSGPPFFRFRLIGGTAQLVIGSQLTGKGLDEVVPVAHAAALTDVCQSVVLDQEPQVREIAINIGRHSFTYQVLVLPLSNEGEAIDRLLLAISWNGDQAPFPLSEA